MAGLLLAGCSSLPIVPMPGSGQIAPATDCDSLVRGSGPYAPPFPDTCPGVQTSGDGLRWIELTRGPDGKAPPAHGATVIVAYEGFLAATGEPIDSSYERGEPAVFNVEDVIEGWTRTLKRMTPGDEWLVHIPAELAYGSQARGDTIPASSDLVFRIRLDGFLNEDELGKPGDQASELGPTDALWNDFLPWDPARDGVKTLKSGLSYYVIQSGTQSGKKAYADDMVAVDYEARLADTGAVVGSSWKSEAPLVVRAGDLIPGFAQAVSLMQPGDVWMVSIPSRIGYGKDGLGEAIPPGADLLYLVNLIAVNP